VVSLPALSGTEPTALATRPDGGIIVVDMTEGAREPAGECHPNRAYRAAELCRDSEKGSSMAEDLLSRIRRETEERLEELRGAVGERDRLQADLAALDAAPKPLLDPEPRNGPNNAEEKDQLEGWAARMACNRRIPLGALQRGMANDWVALQGNPPHSF
jgi:hypothetical protein